MTDLRKAAEMALEALEMTKVVFEAEEKDYGLSRVNSATQALRQALAHPEQEPVGYAHIEDLKREHHDFWVNRERGVNEVPLYAAPPQKQLVGLTDEEIITHFQTNVNTGSLLSFAEGARYAEAKLKENMTDLSKALAQQEQECTCSAKDMPFGKCCKAQPEQKPAMWVTPDGNGFRLRLNPPINDVPLGWEPLYAAPPKKEWVGLTYDERRAIGNGFENDNGHIPSWMSFARAIESKLKEKNT